MDRCSQHSFKSQPSEENEVFLAEQNVPSVDDNIVQEEDLQSEADCPNGECPVTVVKRNSTHSITRVSVNLSRQSSQQQEQQQPVEVSIMMVNDEDDGVQQDEIEPPPAYQQQQQQEYPAINNNANGGDEEEEDVDETFENSYQHAVADQPEEVHVQFHPVRNASMGNDNNNGPQESAIPKSAMPRPNVRQPSQQSNEGEEQAKLVDNAEEKVLSQIRAKRNVANLIAKFSTAATTEEKEKENGGNGGPKQKMDNGSGGAINLQAIRQKFNQQ